MGEREKDSLGTGVEEIRSVPDTWRRAGLRPAYGDHETRKNKQLAIKCCLFFRIS